jgi:hypothetical protein
MLFACKLEVHFGSVELVAQCHEITERHGDEESNTITCAEIKEQ